MNYFVTGIDTDSGKTLASAILCQALGADYWKPVQAGLPKDSDTVRSLVTNPALVIHPETYLLNTPASPHASAKIDHIEIDLKKFILPDTTNTLIIEGAGGCLVPLNNEVLMIDLMKKLPTEIVIIADLYLGSINHTLLTFEALVNRDLKIKGIIFNGQQNLESQQIILKHTQLRTLLHIEREQTITREIVLQYSEKLNYSWNE
jgi:dethiobiotin synthetase